MFVGVFKQLDQVLGHLGRLPGARAAEQDPDRAVCRAGFDHRGNGRFLRMGSGQVEALTFEDERPAVARRADQSRGFLEGVGPRFGLQRPERSVGGRGVHLPAPGLDLVEIDAGVAVPYRPQSKAESQPGERFGLGGSVATRHLHEQRRRGDVVAADDAGGPVGIEALGGLHRCAPAGCRVTSRSLSFFQSPRGACQANTP